MSHAKKDRLFPTSVHVISDAELSRQVAAALREDYGESPSAVKEIGRRTGANLRAIKNWYEARHAPSSVYLLTLARSSPTILKLVLEQVGGSDLVDAFQLLDRKRMARYAGVESVPRNVPIKSKSTNLNERQQWFILELENGAPSISLSIARQWRVSIKTAKRDIAGLKAKKLIGYAGARKKGFYVLL